MGKYPNRAGRELSKHRSMKNCCTCQLPDVVYLAQGQYKCSVCGRMLRPGFGGEQSR